MPVVCKKPRGKPPLDTKIENPLFRFFISNKNRKATLSQFKSR